MADLPAELLLRLKRQAGNRCGYCRTSILITGQPLTIEHIIPLARGGSTTLPPVMGALLMGE
jgi:5-methylcytosine-specific restriction endonuclease McrA